MDLSVDIGIVLGALDRVITFWNLVLIVCGVVGGIVIGIIPGLSAAMAVALLIPITFTLEPQVGISLLVAVFVGGISGGCVTAILIRMPGTPSSVATVIDGFPLAQQGQAGRAIGNAVVASFFGTVISGVILVLSAPALAAFALKFYFAEYVAVCLFGLTAVASLTGSTVSRGLVTALLGMLAATIGVSNVDGLPRFHFETRELMGGINLLPALIGLFAVSQIMHDAAQTEKADTSLVRTLDRVLPSLADVRRNIVNYLRSGVIGTLVGVIPAMGGGPAGLISYAQARNASRHPERFGKGAVEGVIAAEAANNATVGGALIIMLTLGIPGDPVSAILIGGLMVHGLQPGPQLFMNHPDIIYGIYFSVFLSSLTMILVLLLATRFLVRVVEIPKWILLPVLFVLAATGVYSLNNRVFDVLVMCGFGGLGYIFDRYRYPLPPFVLGLVLGPLVEENFRRMVGSEGDAWSLFTRPISATFLALALASVGYGIYRGRGGRQTAAAGRAAR